MPTRKRISRHRALCFSLCVAQAVFLLGLASSDSSAADTSAADTSAADSASTESASNWTQWRGPQRDGRLQRITVPEKLTGALDLVWEKNYSPSYSGPVIYDGLVYTTETVDRKSERVTAHRLEGGEVVWQKDWEGAMAVPFFAAANGDWIRATPA